MQAWQKSGKAGLYLSILGGGLLVLVAVVAGTGRANKGVPSLAAFERVPVKQGHAASTGPRAKILDAGMAWGGHEGETEQQNWAASHLRRSLPRSDDAFSPLPPPARPPLPRPDAPGQSDGLFPGSGPDREETGWGWLADEVLGSPPTEPGPGTADALEQPGAPARLWQDPGGQRSGSWFGE